MHVRFLLRVAAGTACGALLAACDPAAGGSAAASRPAPLVSVVTPALGDMALDYASQGHLVALNQVEVRPQLDARITDIHFREGEPVRAGQLLFSLDADEASAALRRAQAQLAQVEIQLEAAQRELDRATALVTASFVAASALDAARGKLDGLAAQRQGARAELAAARLRLSHTRIAAPIAARAGAVSLHPGGIAKSSLPEPLVTLLQTDPIGVEFRLPEQVLPVVLAAQRAHPLAVSLTAADGRTYEGRLSFIDNAAARDSGTIAMKAVFANPGERLWPGASASVTLHAGASAKAARLPPQALREGAAGPFVYLLGNDERIAAAPVQLLRIQDQQAIVAGLPAGARVVTEGGADLLRAGMRVRLAATAPGVAP